MIALISDYLEENLEIREVIEIEMIKEVGTEVNVSFSCLSRNDNLIEKEETISLLKLIGFAYEKIQKEENNYEDHH